MCYVCYRCIEEPGLENYIRANASHNECAYCRKRWKTARAMALSSVVHWIRHRIEAEYEDPANGVGYESAEGGYQLPTTDTWDLLDELGLGYDLANQDLRQDIFDEMGMDLWVHRNPYSLTEEQSRAIGWSRFCELIKHRVRYLLFPPSNDPYRIDDVTEPSEILDELGKLFLEYGLFSQIGAGTLLYRVRIHSPSEVPPNELESLGPPSAADARFSNRMSPAGVAMFYVAIDEATAIAETTVRRDGVPAQRTVAVFRALKDLLVLDLVQLPPTPSFFDSDEANASRPGLAFLHDFAEDLTRPVKKDGREHVDYVPSQVVTEYVRHRLRKNDRPLNGIRYRSARHDGGVALVLFYEQSELLPQPPWRHEPIFELLADHTVTVDIDTTPTSDSDYEAA